MAQLSHQELQEIVDTDLPGYRVVEKIVDSEDKPSTEADSAGPDIAELREKYLGEEAATPENPSDERGGSETHAARDRESVVEESDRNVDNADDAIVVVEQAEMNDPHDHGSRPKTIVVSGKDRRIVGSQG